MVITYIIQSLEVIVMKYKVTVGDLFREKNKYIIDETQDNIFYVVGISHTMFEGEEYGWVVKKNPKEQHTRTIELAGVEILCDNGNWEHYPVGLN
jgi:hypothetical protein